MAVAAGSFVVVSETAIAHIAEPNNSLSAPSSAVPTQPDGTPWLQAQTQPTLDLPSPVVSAVIADVTERTGLPPEDFRITRFQQRVWPNGCLGLPEPDELCAQALVSGWEVTVAQDQRSWVYRTNATGERVELAQAPVEMPDESEDDLLPPAVRSAVLQDASRRTSRPVASIRIVEAEEQTWPDACLGIPEPGRLCAQVTVPGWEVMVTDGLRTWTYRTDESGNRVKLDPQSACEESPTLYP